MKITSSKKASVILGVLTFVIGEQHVYCCSAFVMEGGTVFFYFWNLFIIFLYFFVKSEKISNYVLPLIFDLHMYTQSYTPLN